GANANESESSPVANSPIGGGLSNEKSPASVPVLLTLSSLASEALTKSVAIVEAGLNVPTDCEANLRLVVETLIGGIACDLLPIANRTALLIANTVPSAPIAVGV